MIPVDDETAVVEVARLLGDGAVAEEAEQPTTKKGRGRKVKLWEARRLRLPIPVWQWVEGRFGELTDAYSASRASHALAQAVVNYIYLSMANEADWVGLFHKLNEPYTAWIEPRFDAMKQAFRETGSQETADAAAAAVSAGDLGNTGYFGRVDDPVALLIAKLKHMGYIEAERTAGAFLRVLERQAKEDWVPRLAGVDEPGQSQGEAPPAA